jgi:hypothetical protein
MRYWKAAAGAATMVLWVGAASAQDKPNFAGKWTPDADKTAAANPNMGGGGGGGGGRAGGRGMQGPMEITVDANTLTITRETPGGAMATTYKLDGSETAITMGQMEAKAKAKWDGAKIVITTVTQTPNGERTSTAEYSLEGDWLVVATTQPPRGGGEPVTIKRYFRKG